MYSGLVLAHRLGLQLARARIAAWPDHAPAPSFAASPQASAPLASQDLAGPPVLPATFLREAVAGFLDRLRAHQVRGRGRQG